jgi:DHA1 family bicyclomycin/chloramphenicol resistance-like MFS transporter
MKKPNNTVFLPNAKKISDFQFEFVALMALMSVVALAIDALLPALDIIGVTIGTTEVVDNQLLIT